MSDYMRLSDQDCRELLRDIAAKRNGMSDAVRLGMRAKQWDQNPFSLCGEAQQHADWIKGVFLRPLIIVSRYAAIPEYRYTIADLPANVSVNSCANCPK